MISAPQRPSPPPADRALARRVAVGTAFGVLYAVINDVIDSMWHQGRLGGPMSALHGAIDQAIPVLTGALVGVALHHVRTRSRLALEAQQRASELRARLQRVERDQAAWVVAAATLHEVRNPLHALGLVLDELTEAVPRGADDAHALLSTAQAQLDRVAEHLARLRSLTESGPPELGPIDVPSLLSSIVAEHGGRARLAGIALELDLDPASSLTARGDASYARIVLENVVDNALGALAPAGRGRVQIRARREGERVSVQIHDDGPGVSPELASRLFEPLRSTKEGGLGLGLSIGRALARAMQGDLELGPGPGTTFTLTLPAA